MNPGEGVVAAARAELARIEAAAGDRLQAEIGAPDVLQPGPAPPELASDAVTRAASVPSLGALAEARPPAGSERSATPLANDNAAAPLSNAPATGAAPAAAVPVYGAEPEVVASSPGTGRRGRKRRFAPREIELVGCAGRSVVVGEELLDALLDALGTRGGGIALATRLLDELTRGAERVDLEPILTHELDASAWRVATRVLLARLYSRLPREREFRHAVAVAWQLHALAGTR